MPKPWNPDASYVKLAELSEKAKDITVAHNKQMLLATPSQEEKQVSDDMEQGRRPSLDEFRRRRLLVRGSNSATQEGHQLSYVVKKILVHGYW